MLIVWRDGPELGPERDALCLAYCHKFHQSLYVNLRGFAFRQGKLRAGPQHPYFGTPFAEAPLPTVSEPAAVHSQP